MFSLPRAGESRHLGPTSLSNRGTKSGSVGEKFKSQFQKSYKREHLIIKWILRITHMNKDGEVDFGEWVQDGKVLSKSVCQPN